jgi:acyl carrier protein
MVSRDEIFEWVVGVLREEFQCKDEVRLDSRLLDDLDLDSIDAIDMTVRLEEKTGLSFGDDDLEGIRTVRDVVDLIDGRL